MIFRDRNTGEIITMFDIMNKFHNTSFPRELESWNQSVLDFAEIDIVIETEKPEDTDEFRHELLIEKENNVWKQIWKKIPNYTEEQIIEKNKIKEQNKWEEFRKKRNDILIQMDHEINRDKELSLLGFEPFSIKGAYNSNLILSIIEYKQKLRELPEKILDIDNVLWPECPLSKIEIFEKDYIRYAEEKKLEEEKELEKIKSMELKTIEDLNR